MNKTDAGVSLLPCPFCGNEVKLHHMNIQCTNLGTDGKVACGLLVSFPHCSATSHIRRLWNTRAAPVPQGDAGSVRAATIEECAQLIESGAGMADLIDQDDLDEQAKLVRKLSLPATEGGQSNSGAPQPRGESVQTNATQPTDSPNSSASIALHGEPWQCMGRKQALPEPGECNWPDCGCDPHATKVIKALLEQGWHESSASPPVMEMREALEPFAKIADDYDAAHKKRVEEGRKQNASFNPRQLSDGHRVSIALGDCRKARTALSPSPTEGTAVAAAERGTEA